MPSLAPLLALAAVALAGCAVATPDQTPGVRSTPAGAPSATVSSTSSTGSGVPSASPSSRRPATLWLCRPGLPGNPCEGRLGTTVFRSDGSTSTEPFRPAVDPGFDCFYVYPTVSKAVSRNAPMAVAPDIVHVARAQAALFQRVCRLYAPVYRQVTLRGLTSGGYTDPAARSLAADDVEAAFDEYLSRYSEGRPFLLLGHSQGAHVLTTLVQRRIDGDPVLRSRLVSAMLIGGAITVSEPGSQTGTFQNIPPCRSATQAGCVLAYNTFAGVPPNPSLFGRVPPPRQVLCVDPAAPSGGTGLLDPIVPLPSGPGVQDVVGFAAFPGSVTSACRDGDGASWLQVARVPGSRLPAAVVTADRGPAWGLHRVDVTLALGTLIRLAAAQSAALGR